MVNERWIRLEKTKEFLGLNAKTSSNLIDGGNEDKKSEDILKFEN